MAFPLAHTLPMPMHGAVGVVRGRVPPAAGGGLPAAAGGPTVAGGRKIEKMGKTWLKKCAAPRAMYAYRNEGGRESVGLRGRPISAIIVGAQRLLSVEKWENLGSKNVLLLE